MWFQCRSGAGQLATARHSRRVTDWQSVLRAKGVAPMAWDPQLRAPLRARARSSPLCQPNAVGKFLRVDPGPRATPRPPPAIALRGAPPSAKPQCAGAAEPSAMATRRRTAPQIHTAALVARPGHQAHPFRDTVGWARPRTPVPHGLALRREQFRNWMTSQSRVRSRADPTRSGLLRPAQWGPVARRMLRCAVSQVLHRSAPRAAVVKPCQPVRPPPTAGNRDSDVDWQRATAAGHEVTRTAARCVRR